MNIDEMSQELGLMQLSDSFFPTGLFATSNGLEFLSHSKKIQGVEEISELIKVLLKQQIGPTDIVALSNSYRFAQNQSFQEIAELDQTIFSMKLIKEIRDTSTRSGIQIIKCVSEFEKNNQVLNFYKNSITKGDVTGVYPVAFAISCNCLGIEKEKAALMMLYGFTVSMVGASLRLGMIQHLEGQKIIHELKPIIIETVQENIDRNLTDLWQFAPEAGLVQISHELMDSKMFIT